MDVKFRRMKIYLGTDHAGFELKEKLKVFLGELGYAVEDKGPFSFDKEDDYPDFIFSVARAVSEDEGSFGVILGGSGQGEAMCANRIKGVRAGVYYGDLSSQIDSDGKTIDMITSLREHNNANIISIGARFLGEENVKSAIKKFIETPFPGDERHARRIKKLDL
jgi:ribose 5-phosphate isomerase B